jgi:hypothetical protein
MIILLCGGFLSPGRIYITILLYWTCWWSSPSLSPLSLFVLSVYFFYSFGFPLKKKRATLTNQLCVMCVLARCERLSLGRSALRCVAQLAAPFLPSFLRDRNMCRNKIRPPRVVWNVSTISPKVVSIPKDLLSYYTIMHSFFWF